MNKKGPRGAGLVVDTHAHWFPEEWVRLVEKEGACCGATITRSGDDLKFTGGGLTSVFSREFVDIDCRLAAMDRQGVDVHALSLTTPMVYFAPPDYALALSQAYNDAAAAAPLDQADAGDPGRRADGRLRLLCGADGGAPRASRIARVPN